MSLIVPIRSDNAYFGFAKEGTPGTAAAPTMFPRWMDGSSIEIDLKAEEVWEGDGSRRLSQVIKNRQLVKIKWCGTPRPNEVGFFETAALGASGDTLTDATVSTTLAAPVAVNDTTISLTANTGLTGPGTSYLALTAGSASEEIVAVTTPGTGTGPYVFTIASSGHATKTHSNSDPVKSSALHTVTDQADGNYYTIEVSIGGTSGMIFRVRDCKVSTCKRVAKAGGLLMYEMEWVGIASVAQVSASTVTLDTHSPFLFTQGTWTLDGSVVGDALAIEAFEMEHKNNIDDTIQTEALTLAATIFGNLEVATQVEVVMTNAQRLALVFFGGSSGTTDSQTIGTGSIAVTFTQPDGFHTLTYTIPTIAYIKAGIPQPKKDGKHFKMSVEGIGTTNMGSQTYIEQTAVTNTTYSAY